MTRIKLAARDHPPVPDKLLALLWWWLPLFAFLPVLSGRSSDYVREHLTAVRCTFLTFIALMFLIPFTQSLALFAQTGDALGSFAQTIPAPGGILNEFFGVYGLEVSGVSGGVDLPVSLGLLWWGAVLLNTLAVSRGRFPYFVNPSGLRPARRMIGGGALATAWFANAVGFAVSGEVGSAIDAIEDSTMFTFFFCMVGGFILLGCTNVFHISSEMLLITGSSLVAAGALIYLMNIDLDIAFPVWLGAIIFGVGLLARLLSEWRARRKARQMSADKGAM